jgi:hypothetical protein
VLQRRLTRTVYGMGRCSAAAVDDRHCGVPESTACRPSSNVVENSLYNINDTISPLTKGCLLGGLCFC